MKWNIKQFDTLPSSNGWALDNISQCAHGDVILVRNQTAGRGRFNRKWVSSANKSLTFSACINPSIISAENIEHLFAAIAALSVHSLLLKSGIHTMLKWPNDVMASGRKIAGILLEKDSASQMIVIGIGLNVNQDSIDFASASLAQLATSMLMETGNTDSMQNLLTILLSALNEQITTACANPESVTRRWNEYDYLTGKKIHIHTSSDKFVTGKYAGLGKECQLLLKTGDALSQTPVMQFWAGDITIARY